MEAKVRHQEETLGIPQEVAAAANAILGANPFTGIDPLQIFDAYGRFVREVLKRPESLGVELAGLASELVRIAAGMSEVAPEPGDKRFADPTWSDNPVYRRIMQAYLAWRSAIHGLIPAEGDGVEWKEADQQRFALRLLTEALAPTNLLPGNPAALKRAFETAGMSLVRGMRNLLDDLWNNNGMPRQVDKRPFTVGRTIAVTPGAVVYRSELIELLQYTPATKQVYERPVMLIPPQINKFYIMDLAPKRSLTEYAVAHGVPFFAISWRNPRPEHRDWGLDDYVGVCKEALSAVCQISASPDVNLLAVCAGGITSSLLLGHLAALGDRRVNAASLIVTMLDSTRPSMTTMFATKESVENTVARSWRKGVLEAAELARTFAWLRPNDLVWNYWVNNYLMGNDPPPYDILFWNSDSTNLPAALHEGFLRLMLHNGLDRAGAVEVLGTPIDLRKVDCDMLVVGGMTDHICGWRSAYQSARLFGGYVEFVLNSTGHVQTLVCPPDNFKARYYLNPRLQPDADGWLRQAREHKGTWWDHWLGWLGRRSGDKREAPVTLGSARFPVLGPAPGGYVLER